MCEPGYVEAEKMNAESKDDYIKHLSERKKNKLTELTLTQRNLCLINAAKKNNIIKKFESYKIYVEYIKRNTNNLVYIVK